MIISSIQSSNHITFKGKYNVRELWIKGKLPTVRTDIYGLPITRKTVSREHIVPKSMGGSADNCNIVLADKFANSRRGCEKLSKFTTLENVVNYFIQFIGIKIKEGGKVRFDGEKYFKSCVPSLKHEGFNLDLRG
jgi:hypothetical protein